MPHALTLAWLMWIGVAADAVAAGVWTCHGAKPGHPTPAERAQFVREASELALKAEKEHGVPAAALAAIAIVESSYGWTRVALEANNLFAWRAGPSAFEAGRAYLPPCDRRRGMRRGYLAFGSRAEGFDHVAGRLAQIAPYREHTDAFKAQRKAGGATAAAVDAWLAGIAVRYSSKPERFIAKVKRVMNDPLEPSDAVSEETNLYRLSAGAAPRR